jgi:glutaredoxin-related protein
MKKWTLFILSLGLIFGIFNIAFSKEELEINFFYGETCPHCAAEQKFLDGIEKKYPEIKINRRLTSDPKNQEILKELCKECDVEHYIGLVPLTFIGKEPFLGFDTPESIGKDIEESIQRKLKDIDRIPVSDQEKILLPLIGEINMSDYSLPTLAIIMGMLDGFNVCSLGALVLILGLVIALRSKVKILIFGGIFIMVTSLVYGILIVLWYQIFLVAARYLRTMEILIGILAIGGSIYFLRQFLKFRKRGPTCDLETGGGISSKFSSKVKELFKNSRGIFTIGGSILLFAVIITIIEFPCSAAVPVVFAGILANSQLPTFLYLLYIVLFVSFYMLD